MYQVRTTNRFEKDVKRCVKRGYNMTLLRNVIELLAQTGTLPPQYHPHKLHADFAGCWECHIRPNWILVWRQDDEELTLLFTNTGTHSDVLDM